MLKRMIQAFRSANAPITVHQGLAVHSGPRSVTGPKYPRFDAGLPLVPVAEVLAEHTEILRRIKLAYGAEQAKFDTDLRQIVERFASYVHLLPATPTNYFRAPAGLLKMSLEVAFYSVQAVDSTLFQGLKTITQRQHLEPRWRLATFIAGLCSELHRTLGHVVVTNDKGVEWPPYLGPLYDWSEKQHADRYHLRWVDNQQESRGTGLFALPHILSPATLQFLAQGNSVVVPHMLASITGTPVYRGTSNVLDSLVRRSVALVIDTELRSNADFYGQHQLGAHLERYLVDALRRLVAAGDWVVNGHNSCVWHAADGMFLVWPRAADEVVRLLDRDQLTGIPKNSETILEILVASGVIDRGEDGEGPMCQILTPASSQPVTAVRLCAEAVITSALPAAVIPLAGNLVVDSAHAKSTALPSTPADPPSSVVAEAPAASPGEVPQRPARSTSGVPRTVHSDKRLATPNTPMPADTPDLLTTTPPPGDLTTAGTTADVASAPPSSTSEGEPASLQLVLRASPRLDPNVQHALSDILSTVGDSSSGPEATIMRGAVFVPLDAFTRRSVDTATAVDSLDGVGVLSRPERSTSKTVRADFNGKSVVGVLIRSDRVDGFPSGMSAPG